MIHYGFSWENFSPAPPAGMKAMASLGMSFVRLWIFWNQANPEPDVYDWSKVDADIAAIRGAGLDVFASILWAPKHAAEGKATYLPYSAGCSDGTGGKFMADRPHCAVPAHIDPRAMFKFARALAERHKHNIAWYGAWNEPLQHVYWPPSASNDMAGAMLRLLHEVTIPFTEGVRSVDPRAKFVGPEADHGAVLQELLRLEELGTIRLFDALSFHPYSWGKFPEDSYRRIRDEFTWLASLDRHGRDFWYTEYGDDNTGKIMEAVRYISEHEDVTRIVFHDVEQWWQEGTWADGTYVRNERGEELARHIGAGRLRFVPGPQPKPLTEPLYQVPDLEEWRTASGETFRAPGYLFVAMRLPKLNIARGTALAVTRPYFAGDYFIVPILNDGFTAGEQTFQIETQRMIDRPETTVYTGRIEWSKLPIARLVDLWPDEGGTPGPTRRRGVRS